MLRFDPIGKKNKRKRKRYSTQSEKVTLLRRSCAFRMFDYTC